MKKTYSAPEMMVVTMKMGDVIATSATIEYGGTKANGVAEGSERGNAIWD